MEEAVPAVASYRDPKITLWQAVNHEISPLHHPVRAAETTNAFILTHSYSTTPACPGRTLEWWPQCPPPGTLRETSSGTRGCMSSRSAPQHRPLQSRGPQWGTLFPTECDLLRLRLWWPVECLGWLLHSYLEEPADPILCDMRSSRVGVGGG